MARLALADLVASHRFSNDNFLKISLFFPIGIILAVIRFNAGIVVWLCSALLSDSGYGQSTIANITCFFLGIHIKKYGKRSDKTRLIVANTVSVLDSLVLNVSTSSIAPSKWDLPPPLAWALGIRHIGVQTSTEQYRRTIKKNFADKTIFIQPEGCPTGGKGLLKFSDWPFTICDQVQPVAIEVNRWFGNVTTGSLTHWAYDSIAWSDLFWFVWNPYTSFKIHLLPVIEKAETETCEEFANRAQKAIADFLKIEVTEHTSNELRELVAGRELERRTNTTNMNVRRMPATSSVRPELQRMAAQIKEILPSVPLSVITKDLGKTRNIDVTLTNILEGSVTYTPEDVVESVKENTAGPSQEIRPPPPLRTAAETFSRTAHDRQLSYQERKVQLVEAARRRYIEKHGLQNC